MPMARGDRINIDFGKAGDPRACGADPYVERHFLISEIGDTLEAQLDCPKYNSAFIVY